MAQASEPNTERIGAELRRRQTSLEKRVNREAFFGSQYGWQRVLLFWFKVEFQSASSGTHADFPNTNHTSITVRSLDKKGNPIRIWRMRRSDSGVQRKERKKRRLVDDLSGAQGNFWRVLLSVLSKQPRCSSVPLLSIELVSDESKHSRNQQSGFVQLCSTKLPKHRGCDSVNQAKMSSAEKRAKSSLSVQG